MWVVKVGEEEESYPYEPISNHLMMEGKVEVEAGVVVVVKKICHYDYESYPYESFSSHLMVEVEVKVVIRI